MSTQMPPRAAGQRMNGRHAGHINGQIDGQINGVMRALPASPLLGIEKTLAEIDGLTGLLAATQRPDVSSQQKARMLDQTAAHLRLTLAGLAQLLADARQLAFHDELTGLPNRALLLDRLDQAMPLSLRLDKRVALLMVDLDGFKQVNDAHGHGTGDDLLKHVAWLLRTCIRASDTVCRYGGDEFVIMLPEIDGRPCADAVVGKIRARLAASFFVEGDLIPITASIGVALFPDDRRDGKSLIERADVLMYEEKMRARRAKPPVTVNAANPSPN
jgi:diguanylate cyclase (GGDEF)-like protein